MINTQFGIKTLGDLNNPDGVDQLGLKWKVTLEGCKQTCRSTWISWNRWKYQQNKRYANRKNSISKAADTNPSVSQQLAYAVSKTAQKLKDEWTAADVKELNKMECRI